MRCGKERAPSRWAATAGIIDASTRAMRLARPPREAGVKAYRFAPMPTPRLRGSLETLERIPGK